MEQPEERPDNRSTDRPDGERDTGARQDRAIPGEDPHAEREPADEREPAPADESGAPPDEETAGESAEEAAGDGEAATPADDAPSEADDGPEDGAEEAAGDGAESPGEAAGPPAARNRLATAASVFGELLITAGVVLGLFVGYSLWWTNVVANQEAQRDSDAVRDAWERPEHEPADEGREYDADAEDGVGFLHVPAMSDDEILVKDGVDLDILNGGVAGLYDDPVESAMPWDEEGNVSLAAHRDGHGAKFHHIDRLDDGDALVFETRDTWYVYRVYATLPQTSPRNTAVLDPVPEQSGAEEPGRYLTLTTCTPVYSSAYRYIVWGELERTEEVDELRTPPPELSEG